MRISKNIIQNFFLNGNQSKGEIRILKNQIKPEVLNNTILLMSYIFATGGLQICLNLQAVNM